MQNKTSALLPKLVTGHYRRPLGIGSLPLDLRQLLILIIIILVVGHLMPRKSSERIYLQSVFLNRSMTPTKVCT